jgi:hypothetical protein
LFVFVLTPQTSRGVSCATTTTPWTHHTHTRAAGEHVDVQRISTSFSIRENHRPPQTRGVGYLLNQVRRFSVQIGRYFLPDSFRHETDPSGGSFPTETTTFPERSVGDRLAATCKPDQPAIRRQRTSLFFQGGKRYQIDFISRQGQETIDTLGKCYQIGFSATVCRAATTTAQHLNFPCVSLSRLRRGKLNLHFQREMTPLLRLRMCTTRTRRFFSAGEALGW